jgi:hypothetical protein
VRGRVIPGKSKREQRNKEKGKEREEKGQLFFSVTVKNQKNKYLEE